METTLLLLIQIFFICTNLIWVALSFADKNRETHTFNIIGQQGQSTYRTVNVAYKILQWRNYKVLDHSLFT